MLESLEGALAEDAALLSAEELHAIQQAQRQLQEAIRGDEVDTISAAVKQLDKVTRDFAARRMDNSVRRALAGHSVDEV